MSEMKALTALAVYLGGKLEGIKVYKYEKPANYTGEYVCLNRLPVSFGKSVNSTGIINVNVHVPDKPDGQPDTIRAEELTEQVASLIPHLNTETEDAATLTVEGFDYVLESDSNCIADTDNTHFVNLRVRFTFTDKN